MSATSPGPVTPPAHRNKPLHLDLSFWIVVVTLVGAADVAQVYYGLPWLRDKIIAAQPAPRMVMPPPVRDTLPPPATLNTLNPAPAKASPAP